LRILALGDAGLAKRLEEHTERMARAVLAK
jgi:hypothetical protein